MAAHPEEAREVDDAGVATGAEVEAVYRAGYPRFLRVAQAITGDPESAHDAVQEGFARALRSREDLRRRGALEPWIWRTVVNVARDRRRTEERRRRRELTDGVAPEIPDEQAPPAEDGHLRRAVGALPERQRLVLFLRYYADLDHRAIATALSIRPGTVGAALHKAHRSLRQRLEEG